MIKKLSHIWYYYKWYIVAGLMLLMLLGSFVAEKKSQVMADTTVSFVTNTLISEAERERISKELAKYFQDSNADGQVYIKVNAYSYDAQAMDAKDPNAFMAAAVQLAAELKLREAIVYFTDQPELLKQAELLSFGRWGDYSALSAISEEYSEYEVMAFADSNDQLNKLK